ncbi:MAG: HAD family hydrolase [Acutalibacteraceae bacterium]
MHKYKAVIFDLDGTLLNTLEDLRDSVNYSLQKFGYPSRTLSEIRNFVGNGIGNLIHRALPSEVSESEFQKVFDTFKSYYAEHCNIKTRPYDGIMPLLERLKKEGYKLAIVSNKADFGVKALNRDYFNSLIDVALGEREGFRRKPEPDTVFAALEMLNVSKSETVYIGDSDVDIKTARNSGLDCISVDWGFRDRTFLIENGAKTIVSAPEELIDLL